MRLIFDMMLVGNFLRILESFDFVPVNARLLPDGVNHRDSFERLAEIHLDAVVDYL